MAGKKEVFALLLILGIVIGMMFVAAEKSVEKDGKKISSAVLDRVNGNGEVRVYIKYRENSSRSLASEGIEKSKIRHVLGDTISAQVNLDDIKKLESDPAVESVSLVGVRHIELYQSVPLINATATWALQTGGMNLTGAGETICILDTGVDYTHPDLGGCYGNNNASSTCKVIGGYDFVNNDGNPMDDQGHGTHVTGIAAANGAINGVAPGAKVLMFKVCDSGGNCFDDDMNASIYWCIANKTAFNISVISISIGGGSFSSHCEDDSLAPAINAAVGAGIPVVVAAGNSGNLSEIMAPACVENATPVTSTRKDDVTFDYKRDWMVNLAAPGYSITSTAWGGGYTSMSGTSMATPHAAGAFAIAKQYLDSQGIVKTPKQIEMIYNNTGKLVYDSLTNKNYSRINVYAAIISMDNQSPSINLLSPGNGTTSINVNQTFRCNATDLSLKNLTFYLWNSTSVYNQTFSSATSGRYNFEINVTNIPLGVYKWNCGFTDENNNRAVAVNYSITVGDYPSVILSSPLNGLRTNNGTQELRCNATSISGFANASFYLWNSTALENLTVKSVSGTSNSTGLVINLSHGDSYTWNCVFTNGANLQGVGTNYTLVYDITAPGVTINNPGNGTTLTSSAYTVNISLNENGSCLYSLDGGATNKSMTTGDNIGFTADESGVANGNYLLNAYCNDSVGNLNLTQSSNFSVSVSSSSGGGGGGGGGNKKAVLAQNTTTTQPPVSLSPPAGNGGENNKNNSGEIQFGPVNETPTVQETTPPQSRGVGYYLLIAGGAIGGVVWWVLKFFGRLFG